MFVKSFASMLILVLSACASLLAGAETVKSQKRIMRHDQGAGSDMTLQQDEQDEDAVAIVEIAAKGGVKTDRALNRHGRETATTVTTTATAAAPLAPSPSSLAQAVNAPSMNQMTNPPLPDCSVGTECDETCENDNLTHCEGVEAQNDNICKNVTGMTVANIGADGNWFSVIKAANGEYRSCRGDPRDNTKALTWTTYGVSANTRAFSDPVQENDAMFSTASTGAAPYEFKNCAVVTVGTRQLKLCRVELCAFMVANSGSCMPRSSFFMTKDYKCYCHTDSSCEMTPPSSTNDDDKNSCVYELAPLNPMDTHTFSNSRNLYDLGQSVNNIQHEAGGTTTTTAQSN